MKVLVIYLRDWFEGNYLNGIDALKKWKGAIVFDKDDKDIILKDIASNRGERRIWS